MAGPAAAAAGIVARARAPSGPGAGSGIDSATVSAGADDPREAKMRRALVVSEVVLLLVVLAAARPAPADRRDAQSGDARGSETQGQDWSGVCARALEQRIRSEHPHTDQVELVARNMSEWAYSRGEVAVAGDGRMLRGKSWDDFDFVCLVEMRSSRVSALEWSGPLRDDGTPVRPGVQRPTRLLSELGLDSAAGRGCAEAVGAEIRREHPRAGRVDFEHATLRQWRRSQFEIGARGEGSFAGFRGRPHPFEFSCVWDARRGGVTSVFYELQ
jgi:hypothetical protein